jgi:hypothetical protein
MRILLLSALVALTGSRAMAQTCVAAPPIAPALIGQAGCHLTDLGLVPLTELGCRRYQGFEGGLYPNGANEPPAEHELLGQIAAAGIQPLSTAGTADSQSGRIGFASIGMSNASQEFQPFIVLAREDRLRDPAVVVVNGAQGGRPAEEWANPTSPAWPELDRRLAGAGLSRAQLQVVWIKHAMREPGRFGPFPASAEELRNRLADIVRIAKSRYPNLRVAYLSSRTRAYTTVATALNPEPFAYESGFAVKWLIEGQVEGRPSLRFGLDGKGPAPWLAWGPYLWADGEIPREDGFRWPCRNVASDFTHPSTDGRIAVAELLLDFLHHDPSATWYRASKGCGLLGIEPLAALVLARAARRVRRRRSMARS